MAQASLNSSPVQIDTSNDSIVIRKILLDIPGGKTLDVSGYTPTDGVLRAGHILIEQTSNKEVKPLDVSAGAYVALPTGHTYKGVLIATILKAKPQAAVMLGGDVNEVASPYPVPAGAKTALTHILFTQD